MLKKKSHGSFIEILMIIFNVILYIFSFVNAIILLFYIHFTKYELFESFNKQYTQIIIICFCIFLVLRIITKGINSRSFRNHAIDILFLLIIVFFYSSTRLFQIYILSRQTFLLIRQLALYSLEGKVFKSFTRNPPAIVLLSFLITILLGTMLLMLPISTNQENSLINTNNSIENQSMVDKSINSTSFLGALFTATSATCVTGLIIYDTGTHFSLFGQNVILLLIQIGGLGIMTISTAFAILLGQRMTLRSESLMQNVVGGSSRLDMIYLVKIIVGVTLLFEIAGSVFLFFVFKNICSSTSEAVYCSVFHSISAFCNAGFSIFPDSFMSLKTNWMLNLTIMSLIIFGGIGFSVILDINKNMVLRWKPQRMSLHTKLVLAMSAVLIAIGFICFFISEYHHTMQGTTFSDRVIASLFQSVTTRTAGFNTIDNGLMSKASVFISIILMFIGASPGSTGGGVKTTTLAIFILSVWAIIKGNKDVSAYQRKIADDNIRKVMVLIVVSLSVLFTLVFVLLIWEPFSFEKTIFEAFSAFGTVGLSMGITSGLTIGGKCIIILLMYLGRVGPLTFLFALSEKNYQADYSFIEEKVSIG